MRHTKPPEGMSQTGLFKRGGSYYFRLRIPKDLISHYGKREFKFSLDSKDRSESIRKVRAELARLELEFADVRQRLARSIFLNELAARRVTSLDDDSIAAIAATWLEQNLAADDSLRRMGEVGDSLADIEHTVQTLRPAYALGETQIIEPAMDQFVAMLGIELAISIDERRRLALKFLEASLQAASIRASRLQGEVIATATVVPPTTPTLAPARSSGVTLTHVLSRWKKAVERRPRTLDEMSSLVKEFESYSQSKPLKSITRQDGIGFRDHLKATRDLAPATLEKNLGLISTLLNFAVDEGLVGANPFSRIKVVKPKTAPVTRLPYSKDDLKAIFSCPLYLENDRPRGGSQEAAVWLPLIAAYSGARLEEIALLMPRDIVQDPEQGWYFDINDIGEGKHVKTASSRRRVPIHPVLIKVGIIGYRDAMAKEAWLFPNLVPAKNGQRSGNWSKWWGRYARQTIGLSALTCFHSFRHSFKTACRAAGIEEAVHDSLTGHASVSVGRKYGEQPLSVLRAAIDRVTYPDVVQPAQLWPPPIAARSRHRAKSASAD